ncbi:MAG: GspH/FimT family pseudopilin [Halieaceae bacterium]|jgi:type IV fimbrial biogenesis protein FimT|nr:GspH/FimT family pseudopilin [Halieaceae bacterium]
MRGFTLLELLVTLAILAVLLTVALPGFSAQINDARAKSAGLSFYAAVMTARNIARGQGVATLLCPLASGPAVASCGDDFSLGAVVMADKPTGLEVIRVWMLDEAVRVWNRTGSSPVDSVVRFEPSGLGNRNLTLSACAGGANWALVLNRIGRPRLERDGGQCPN